MNETSKQRKGISVLQKIINTIGGERLVLIGAIIVVFILFSSMNSNFFSLTNIINLLVAASLVGLVAIGHTYLIVAGQNDLSPGSLAALSGTLCALLVSWKIPLALSILLPLAVAAPVGVCNAMMVNKIKLDPFIATLVSQAILRGFAYIICDGKPVAISDPAFIEIGKARFAGIPLSVWIMLLSIGIFGFILAKTKFGRSIYAIGGNKDAARLAGLNPQKIILICFVMMGLFCGIGGIVFAARMNSGQPAANVNLEFDAITEVILGGVSFTGGFGNLGCTVLGIILL